MLVADDPNILGDKLLSPHEALLKVQDERRKADARFRLPDQEHLVDIEARLGKPLKRTEFVRRVLKIAKYPIYVEASNHWLGGWNFYATENGQKVCLAAAFDCPDTIFEEEGQLPEFSIIVEDDKGLPGREIRGWRTVLDRLIKAKAITKRGSDKEFGRAFDNQSSERWRASTRQFS